MTIETSEDENVYRLSYCIICDASSYGGDNPFLKGLGELQRQHKVELSLETCKDCQGTLWKIKYNIQ
jgi:hypothetical protein